MRAAFECEVIKYDDVIWSETEVECDTAADAWVGGLSLQHAAELEACRSKTGRTLRLQHWLAACRIAVASFGLSTKLLYVQPG